MYLHVIEQLYVKYMFQGTKGTIQKTSAIHYLTTTFHTGKWLCNALYKGIQNKDRLLDICIIGHYLQALIVFNLLFKEHRNSYSYYMHLIYTMRRYKQIVCFSFTQLMKDFYIQLLDNICLLTMQRFVKTKNTIIHQHNNSIKK